jgi:hypothetical protein
MANNPNSLYTEEMRQLQSEIDLQIRLNCAIMARIGETSELALRDARLLAFCAVKSRYAKEQLDMDENRKFTYKGCELKCTYLTYFDCYIVRVSDEVKDDDYYDYDFPFNSQYITRAKSIAGLKKRLDDKL